MLHLRVRYWHFREMLKLWRYLEHFEMGPHQDNYPNYSRLCTACHILDKGLHIREFEVGHSTRVYRQAKNLMAKIPVDAPFRQDEAFLWCTKVIELYEAAQKSQAVQLPEVILNSDDMDRRIFDALAKSRVSCRDFLADEVPEQIWKEIVGLALCAPNSCCRQAVRYYIVHNSEIIQKLVPLVAGATGFNKMIPYLIFVTGDLRVYSSLDHRLPYIDAALSLDLFSLAARTRGILSTILNFEHATDQERKTVHSLLDIPDHERIIIISAAGKPNKVPAKPGRMSLERVIKIIK